MCPACIATMTLLVAGSASTGGLSALVAKKFRRKSERSRSPAILTERGSFTTKFEAEHPKTVSRSVDRAANKYERHL
jgi:hypothetical protein